MQETTFGSRHEALLRSLHQVGRALLRLDDAQELVNRTVDLLAEQAGSGPVQLVHWNGLQPLASAARGSLAPGASLPACLRGHGTCQGCAFTRPRVDVHTVIPLRGQQSCRGALLLDALDPDSEQFRLLGELGEDLGLKLERLQQRRTLLSRDEIRREVEKLGRVGGWEFDPVTGEGDWTEEVARIHDLDPDSPIDKDSGLDYYHPDSRPLIEKAVARCLEGGEGYDLELQLVSAKGVLKWVRALGAPVLRDGKVVLVRGLLQDISARKAAEEDLRRSQERAQAIFDNAGIGLSESHAATRGYRRVNRKLCEILGYTQEELLAKTWAELTPPEDLHSDVQIESDFQQGLMKQTCFEKRYLHKEGRIVWVRVTVASMLEDGYFIATVEDIGERRQAEVALREQKQRLRTMFDWMQAGVMVVCLSTRCILEVNPCMQRLVGWDAPEMLGRNVTELRLFDNLADVARLRAEIDRTGALQPVECRVRRKCGEVGDFLLTGGVAPIDGEDCAIVLWHDLSELRRADAALRQSESQLRVMFEMAPVGIAQADPATGLILSANERYCKITGYTADELKTMTVAQLSHPEDNLRHRGKFADALRSERPEYHLDKRYLRKDGSIAWVRVDVSILRDAQGNPTRSLAVIEDISQAKGAEQALRASQERYQALVDHLEDVVFSLDSQLRIVYVNPSVRRLGYCPEQLVGRHILRLICKEDRAQLRSRPPATEWRLLDRAGKVRWFRINIGLQPDQKLISGVAVDVTQQKTTEEQLVAAQKMEAIGRLAGGVAHDFNNLLTVILSYTELSMDELGGDDPVREDLQEVLDAGERAKSLTRQLLAFSRRQVLSLETLDLNALVGGVERMLTRLIGEDITLRLEPSARIWPVRADRSQLEQVLLNLAVNARDAMPNGGLLCLRTGCRRLSEERARALDIQPGDYSCISVQDGGCGITEEVMANLFEPFFTTKAPGHGTGLGLSMVYGIVRQSGGAVEVESEPGRGSCFHVYLPACPEAAADKRPARISPATRGGSETLLVVEDEPALLQLARRSLSSCGYEVLCASNGDQALLLAREQGERIALVLSDVVMPGMNGPDLLARLRPLCPSARVLFMSGYSHDVLNGRGVCEHEVLTKPFDAPTLRAAVRARLDG
jgi:two-component system cell cycle sensor histidine kinase/response regulator CckA